MAYDSMVYSKARKFIKELGKRITTVTGEVRDKLYLSASLSGIQRGNMLSFIGSFTTDTD